MDAYPIPQRLLILLLGGVVSTAAGQTTTQAFSGANAFGNCSQVLTTKDASRCIGSINVNTKIPKLETDHPYTLPELIDIAQSASPEGRIAWAEAKVALEKAGISRAEYLPLLSLMGQGSDMRIFFPFPKPIAPRGYVTVEEPTVVAQLELEYTLLDFGRGHRFAASKAAEIASTLRLNRTHQTIAFTTATQYYRTQQAVGQLAAAKTILDTAQTLRSNAQSQFDNGRATLPDVQNAVAGEAEALYNLATAEGEVKKAKLGLTESIGIEPTTEIEIVPASPEESSLFEQNVEELIQAAWKTRPDLLAKVQDLRHAQESYKTAHSAYMPKVGLTGGGGQTSVWPSADYGQLGPGSVTTWQVAAQLRWDIFNGARGHEVKAALAEQKAAAETLRATEDAVTRQVWDAYTEYQTALEQDRASKSFLASSQISYDSSLDAFKYGVRSLVDVVQAEKQLAQARLESVRAQARRLQTEVALSYATGKMVSQQTSPSGARP